MKIRIQKPTTRNGASELKVILVSKEDLDLKGKKKTSQTNRLTKLLGKDAPETISQLKFSGKHLQTTHFLNSRANNRSLVLLIGFDVSEKDSTRARLNSFRALGAKIVESTNQLGCKNAEVLIDPFWIGDETPLEALVEGLELASYRYRRYKTKESKEPTLEEITIVSERTVTAQTIQRSQTISQQVAVARDLINTPANDLRPSDLAAICRQQAKKFGLQIEVLDTRKLTALGAGGILGVGMGSNDKSYLISLSYKPKKVTNKKKIALVGKAITFDSGGYVIKHSMDTMKCDMSGGAAVLAATCAIAALKLPIEITTYIPIAENMINGNAVRPGDILKLLSGKTVEVLNTDAEGRLVLADALTYALRKKPDLIIDLATLTGACVAALGSKYAGLFSNNDELADALINAGDLAGEALWRLPLAPEYRKILTSPVADYKNLFKEAGAVTAALFLEEFVGDTTWAHLDIAGPAFTASDEGYIRAGGVGFGVRTIVRFIEGLLLPQ